MKLLLQPLNGESVGEELKKILNSEYGAFTGISMAVAFAKASGVRHLEPQLREYVANGHQLKVVVGVDHNGTSIEALQALLDIADGKAEIYINYSIGNYITFHPKIYLFENEESAIVIIGSNNLTEGGLFTNDEASVMLFLKLEEEQHKNFLARLKEAFAYWSDEQTHNSLRLNNEVLQQLIEQNYIIPEQAFLQKNNQGTVTEGDSLEYTPRPEQSLFGKSAIRRVAPTIRRPFTPRPTTPRPTATALSQPISQVQFGFVMTLQKTDVGTGQTTPGTTRRSPEIFVPLAARDRLSDFWGWQDLFNEDHSNPGKFDRVNVRVRIGGDVVPVNMMTWPAKHDFRLRSEALRSAGNIGDILRIEKVENDDFDYYVEIIPQQSSSYAEYLAFCSEITRNSTRRWGYYEIQPIDF